MTPVIIFMTVAWKFCVTNCDILRILIIYWEEITFLVAGDM
jgi:hypothetical protein